MCKKSFGGIFYLGILSFLSACNSGNGGLAPSIFNTSTSGQCQDMVTGTQCTISFDYNNYGQRSVLVVNSALPTLAECKNLPSNGCGIIYDGSFNQSANQCTAAFNSNAGSGVCNVKFTYTSGVSGGDTNALIAFLNTYDGASSRAINVTGN